MTQKIVTLKYMQDFQCLGGDCPDTCCAAWDIVVDKPAFKRAKKAIGEKRAKESFTRKSGPGSSDLRFMLMNKNADGHCVFLKTDGLCDLHGTHGEAVLSNVCSMFPRRVYRMGDTLELSASPGCPEVTRLLLTNSDSMNVVAGDPSMIPRLLLRPICKVNDENLYLRHVDDIRTVLLSLLATPHFSLNEGSFLMVYFANKIKDLYKDGCGEDELAEIAKNIDFITRAEVQEEIVQQYRNLAPDNNIALALGSVILETAASNKAAQRFRRLTMEVLASIMDTDQSTFFNAYNNTQQVLQERAAQQLTQYFGNFCAHYLVHNSLTDADNVLDYVERLFLTKALIQLLMFCHPEMQAATELPDDEMHAEIERLSVHIFYLVTRAAHHSKVLTTIQQELEKETERFALATLLISL